jgi:dTMP kinase
MTYYAIVGCDGQGKTTVINRIQDSGYNGVFTREPYQTLKVKKNILGVDQVETTYIFALDRHQHMRDVIIPAKKEGRDIISDRCYLCSVVYQSESGIDARWIMAIQPTNLVFPDAVIWMQGDPAIAAQRSGEVPGRLADLQRGYGEVLNSYELPMMAWYPVNVDGKSEDEVYVEIATLIDDLKRKR